MTVSNNGGGSISEEFIGKAQIRSGSFRKALIPCAILVAILISCTKRLSDEAGTDSSFAHVYWKASTSLDGFDQVTRTGADKHRRLCEAMVLCEVVVKVVINGSHHLVTQDILLHSRIRGPETIISPSNISEGKCKCDGACDGEIDAEGHVSAEPTRYFCIQFTPMEGGVHIVSSRIEYSSRNKALLDFAPNTPNTCFLGIPLEDIHVSVAACSALSVPREKVLPGYWSSREGDRGLRHQPTCASFFSPLAISEVLRETFGDDLETTPDLKAAHAGLKEGVALWDLIQQARAILRYAKTKSVSLPDPVPTTVASLAEKKLEAIAAEPRSKYAWVPRQVYRDVSTPRHSSDSDRCLKPRRLGSGDTNTRECLRSLSPLYFVVDSVGRYVYHYLLCSEKIKFRGKTSEFAETEDGIEIRFLEAHGLTIPSKPPQVEDILMDHITNTNQTPVTIVINTGLWDVAYGNLKEYQARFHSLTQIVAAGIEHKQIRRAFFLGISQVNPILYKGLSHDSNKQYMTKPRVDVVNRIQRSTLERPEFKDLIQYIDTWDLTRGREDNPLQTSDMRHYGSTVVREMTATLLEKMCQGVD